MRNSNVLCAALLLAVCGCGGGGDSELLAAIPDTGFAGRTTDVVLVANDTGWGADTTADFGEGVTVNSVEVLGDGAMVANITLADDAALGPRDISVGGEMLEAGFTVASAFQIETQGTIAQGSLAVISITNLDVANPFDITTTGDGFFTPIEYVNFSATMADGHDTLINFVEPYSAELIILTDVDAAEGPAMVDVASGPSGEEVHTLGEVTVSARSATVLSAGTPATGTISTAFDSVLYELTPAQFSLLSFALTTTSETAAPAVALLPASGSFDDLIRFSANAQIPGDGKLYAVVWENRGSAPYDFTLAADAQAATQQPEAEANDDSDSAQPVGAVPSVVTAGSLSSVTDEDWYAVAVPAGNNGKGLHVVTMAGDPGTDTIVEIFAPNGTNSLGGPSDDFGVHEDWTSTALGGPGTYFVKVTASADFFDPSSNNYDLLIEIVDEPATEE